MILKINGILQSNPLEYIQNPNLPWYDQLGIIGGIKEGVSSVGEGIVVLNDGFSDFVQLIREIKAEGFWYAITGKHFSNWLVDFFKDIGIGILEINDVLFLAPAILLMIATFFIGKNKYTKFIVPAWFLYFITEILSHIAKGG